MALHRQNRSHTEVGNTEVTQKLVVRDSTKNLLNEAKKGRETHEK